MHFVVNCLSRLSCILRFSVSAYLALYINNQEQTHPEQWSKWVKGLATYHCSFLYDTISKDLMICSRFHTMNAKSIFVSLTS